MSLLHHWRSLNQALALLLGVAFLSLVTPPAASTAPIGNSGHQGWRTFHDPVYGFSLSYPGSWTLTTANDGSHMTLLNPATKTTLSPLVTTAYGTVQAILQQPSPAHAVNLQMRTVAGHQALDYVLPSLPTSAALRRSAAAPVQQVRQVVVPVTNAAGSINVYAFLLTQPTTTAGKLSATEQAENAIFATILSTFTLPSATPSAASSTAASGASAACNRICWADNNWSYTYYDDSSGPYSFACDGYGYDDSDSYSTSTSTCVDGNIYGAQVLGPTSEV